MKIIEEMDPISESEIKKTLLSLFSNKIIFAYLLGSAGTPRFQNESDVDLAVYWKNNPDFSELSMMKGKLEDSFQRDVDLVSINTTDLIFSRQILETGRLLLCKDDGFHLKWKAEQLSQYPDFKFSRKRIEENILKRKKMSEFDVVLSKINIIKNCLSAIERASSQEKDEFFKISIFELNLQRAIQACIDLANVVLSQEALGLPNTYRMSFDLLKNHSVIPEELCKIMISMVGFRNISVHDYEEIKPEIVKSIVSNHLHDFEKFYTLIHDRAKNW